MARSAATRKYRNNFDPKPFYELVSATVGVNGLATLPDGRFVDFAGWKPGKVTAHVMTIKAGGSRRRTFGVHQSNEIAEWVLSGELEAEEQDKRVKAAAFELLDALRKAQGLLMHPEHHNEAAVHAQILKALASATGKP